MTFNKEAAMLDLLNRTIHRLAGSLENPQVSYDELRELRNRVAGAFDAWKKSVEEG